MAGDQTRGPACLSETTLWSLRGSLDLGLEAGAGTIGATAQVKRDAVIQTGTVMKDETVCQAGFVIDSGSG